MIVSWCFEVLDSLRGYDDEFKLQYATGESYMNWKKRGLIPKHGKSKDLTPGSVFHYIILESNTMATNFPLAVMLYQKRSKGQVPPLFHSPILAFAQLDLIALRLEPRALGQSCLSRVTYANQSLSMTSVEPHGKSALLLADKPVESLQVERPLAPLSFADSLREQRDLVARHPARLA